MRNFRRFALGVLLVPLAGVSWECVGETWVRRLS